MAVTDLFAARFAGPAGKVLDAPIRALVHEILREQGYASPSEVQSLRDDAKDMGARLARAETRLSDLARGQDVTLVELREAREGLKAAQVELGAARAMLATQAEQLAKALAAPVPPKASVPAVEAVPAQTTPAPVPAAKLAPAAAAPAPLVAEPKGACSVPGCGKDVRSKGFCSPHYQQWRRGNLEAFVGAEGHVTIGGRSFRVAASHATRHAQLDGDTVKIDGKAVAAK